MKLSPIFFAKSKKFKNISQMSCGGVQVCYNCCEKRKLHPYKYSLGL